MNRPLMWLAVFLLASPLYAQKVGDELLVVTPAEARLTVDGQTVASVPRGAVVVVEEVGKDRLRVTRRGVSGWIIRQDVLPPEKAIDFFTQAIAKKPTANDYRGRGSAHAVTGQYDKALADYTEAIRLNPKDVDAFCNRGLTYEKKGQYNKAIADHTEAIRLDPKLAAAYCGRAGAYARKESYDSALTDLNKAIELNPKDADTFCARGFTYEKKGDRDKAIADYTEAIRLNPKDAEAFAYRGDAWLAKNDYDKAIADLSQAIRLDPKNVALFYDRATAYRERGDYDKAITDYTEAIRLDPKDASEYRNRALAYENKDDYEKAVADLSECIRLEPKDGENFLQRSWAYDRQGDRAKAVADLEAAKKLGADAPTYYERRAAALIGRGDYDKGLQYLQAALRLNPKDPAAKFEDWPKPPLSAEALEHGRQQVRQMLKDRPAMAQYGDKARVLRQWAARKFAGEDLRELIFWNNSEPEPPFNADNCGPTTGEPGLIRVCPKYYEGPNKGKERSFEEMWADVVFELYNITGAKEFDRLNDEAAHGSLSKEQYVTKKITIESRAAEKTRAFYIHIFLPWAKEQHVSTNPDLWRLGLRSEPNQDLVLPFVAKSDAYWRDYENYYDHIVLGPLIARGEDQQADKLTAEMLARAKTNVEKAAIYSIRGAAYDSLGKLDKAIAAYSEVSRLNPKDAAVYERRGYEYEMDGDLEKAIAEYTEAIRFGPTRATAFCRRAAAYMKRGYDLDKAIADYTAAIRLGPKDADTYYARGSAYEQKGEIDKAAADYTEAIRVDPKYAPAYHARGLARFIKGEKAKAEEDFAQAKKLESQPKGTKETKKAAPAKAGQGS
jgi:tetratricopeptide (TPR) repeat protein